MLKWGNFIAAWVTPLETLSQYKLPFTSQLRKKIQIAVIDDEGFTYQELLQENGYHIQHFKDIKRIDDLEQFQIILCDIMGVGRLLTNGGEGDECNGNYIIHQARKRFPEKIILAYTGTRQGANQGILSADEFINKDISQLEWMETLDKYISLLCDPIYLWVKVRAHLLKFNIPMLMVLELEQQYINDFMNSKPPLSNMKELSHYSEEAKLLFFGLKSAIKLFYEFGD